MTKGIDTRRRRETKLPHHLKDYEVYYAYCTLIKENDEPDTYSEAIKAEVWQEAIRKELNSLEKLHTCKETDLPPGKKAIDTRWVFKQNRTEHIKRDLWQGDFNLRMNYRPYNMPLSREWQQLEL